MDTQDIQNSDPESFTATLTFSASKEQFKANRVGIEETKMSSGIIYWVVKACEDTRDKKDGTKETNTIMLYINKDLTGENIPIGAALPPPDTQETSAGYYKLKDSPDDDDDLIDTAYGFPSTQGKLSHSWSDKLARFSGTFNFKVKNPDDTCFEITGTYNIDNKGMHSILNG